MKMKAGYTPLKKRILRSMREHVAKCRKEGKAIITHEVASTIERDLYFKEYGERCPICGHDHYGR